MYTQIMRRLRNTGTKHVDSGLYFQLTITISNGHKKKGNKKLTLNMTKEFGLTSDTKPVRVQQFSFIGAAMLLMQLESPKIKSSKMTKSIDGLDREQLRVLARAKNVRVEGTKAELVQRMNLQHLMQDRMATRSSTRQTDELLNILQESDDDDDDTALQKTTDDNAKRVGIARNSRWSSTKQTPMQRARKGRRISPIDYRPPTKRRLTDAQRKVHVTVARIRDASEDYKKLVM